MATQHKMFWHQGKSEFSLQDCEGGPKFSCPQSKDIAAEYERGYYTYTNVLLPQREIDDIGQEMWVRQHLRDLKVGDYIWLALVPPLHYIEDVFAFNSKVLLPHSDLSTMGGFSFTLVSGTFTKADDDGKCEMSDEKNHGTLVCPATSNPDPQFVRADVNEFLDLGKYRGIGLKIEAMPNKKTLADVVARIVVGAHVRGYDGQVFML